MSTLYVMIGLPGSGKSTLAKQIAAENDCVLLSSDALRQELYGDASGQEHNSKVFYELHKRAARALAEGKNVIADATHVSVKSRRALLSAVHKIPCTKKAIVVATSIALCKERNLQRERSVPENVIEEQLRRFQIPFYEEGFDEIKIFPAEKVRVSPDFCRVGRTRELFEQTIGFDQKNPHHNLTLQEHCRMATEFFAEKNDRFDFQLGALYHDIGKLYTQKVDELGAGHYYNHENVGAYVLSGLFHDLKKDYGLSHDEALNVLFLVNYHMLPFRLETEKSKEKYRRLFGDEKFQVLMDFHECDKRREYTNNSLESR